MRSEAFGRRGIQRASHKNNSEKYIEQQTFAIVIIILFVLLVVADQMESPASAVSSAKRTLSLQGDEPTRQRLRLDDTPSNCNPPCVVLPPGLKCWADVLEDDYQDSIGWIGSEFFHDRLSLPYVGPTLDTAQAALLPEIFVLVVQYVPFMLASDYYYSTSKPPEGWDTLLRGCPFYGSEVWTG